MKHTRGLMSVAQALRQTFVTPFKPSGVAFFPAPAVRHGIKLRLFHESRRLAGPTSRQPVQGPIKDEAIGAPYVQIVNEHGDLEMPVRLSDVLRSFDRSKFFLHQVSPGSPGRPPICKITDKLAYSQREKEKAKAAKATKSQNKQIELNWAIDAHDLEHRLKQLTTFLEKGRKVEVTLTRKRRKRAPTVDEIKHVIQSVLDTTKNAGATQVKAMEGEPGQQMKITVRK
ncbi:translation initiation factor IF3 [Penicillium capsulatum]|uniref:Translation initiation factor IF3 n=1 Tax=Penicillium capsulatum TaxID=69766 RepID=A0A9W9HYU0_9EURO|nr:translation initiation factor IF3 [Penicillium capsulatum]KAJ6116709.1 translation initiation factor IF3 [Penicillium capsulatum]